MKRYSEKKDKCYVLDELRHFIKVVTEHRNNRALTKQTLIKASLNLLDDLPASREIVFEYFALLADIGVKSYVAATNNADTPIGLQAKPNKSQNNNNQQQQNRQVENECFMLVQTTLQNLIIKGPPAWTPLIASWSLDVVGSLSEKYAKRRMPIDVACNYWLNCSTMRTILSLINMCFRKLSNAESDSCVGILLSSFNRYPMTFDWVVARLGGCFPKKIFTQILQCALKRFADDYRCQLDAEVGILEYLSYGHEQEQKMALKEMLQDGFQPKKNLDISIIPFLTVVSTYSETLLQNIVGVFLEMYTDELREIIVKKYPLWMNNKLFADMQPSLNNLVLHLREHGAKLLISVANMTDQYPWCQDFLEYSLQELDQYILSGRPCSILLDLAEEETKHLLWQSCLSTNLNEQQTAVRLLLITSTQNPHIYYQTISELLRKSYKTNSNGFGALVRIIVGQYGIVDIPNIMPGLQMVLEEVMIQEQMQSTRLPLDPGETSEAYNTFYNLNILAKMQKKNLIPHITPDLLTNTLNECLPKLLQILELTVIKLILRMDAISEERNEQEFRKPQANNYWSSSIDIKASKQSNQFIIDWNENKKDFQRLQLAHIIIDLLNTIEAAAKGHLLRTTEVLKLAVLSVKYFFIGLTEQSFTKRTTAFYRVYNLLRRQCSTRKMARTACLRELIEGALFYYGYLFGQHEEPDIDELEIQESEMLINQNNGYIGSNSNRSVLHSGIIGRGLRAEAISANNCCDAVVQKLFLKALYACCCTDGDKPNSTEGFSLISLMLVELVSTDVMYNGLPFPDEEFMKVTIERDLLIRRAFVTSPILWAILGLIATHRPALCFSSVLLRALCATCIQQWRAKNVNRFERVNSNDELMQCTKKLLELLSISQLIPPPLSSLHMIIQLFEPPEIVLLLRECIWSYLKDHVPSPALFQVDSNGLHWRNQSLCHVPPQYVDTLRHLMQKNLAKFGPYYYQMFIMIEQSEANTITTTPTVSTMTLKSMTIPIATSSCGNKNSNTSLETPAASLVVSSEIAGAATTATEPEMMIIDD